jgi:hypothetical protein
VTARPSPGDLIVIDGRASVQFAGERALTFRVVSVSTQPTYEGWVWLTGYVLDRRGDATARREIFVQLAGLSPPDDSGPIRSTVRHTSSARRVASAGAVVRPASA